jgi:hypothetical protein
MRPATAWGVRRAARWLLAALVLAGSSCTLVGDELYPLLDDVAPEVIASFPEQGWLQVPTGITLEVWFSEPIEPATVGRNQVTLFSGDHLQRCRYQAEQTPEGLGLVRIEPVEALIAGVHYRLEITRGITDRAGNPLAAPFGLTFDTLR